jgi:hypothetical protein
VPCERPHEVRGDANSELYGVSSTDLSSRAFVGYFSSVFPWQEIVDGAMSTHSYGRHGPHAWRKWHARRFEQPLSPRMAVVFLRLPRTIERLVLVLMPDDLDNDFDPNATDGNSQGSTIGSLPSGKTAGDAASDQQLEKLNVIGQVGNFAFIQGRKKGIDDRERYDVLSQEELEDEAARLSIEYVSATENRELLVYDSRQITRLFERQYQEGYLEGAKLKSLEELPSRWKRMIQRQAHRDREQDERRGDALSDDPLLTRAIHYGLEDLGQRTADAKRRMVECVSVYLEAYRNYRLPGRYEQERGPFRSPL